MCASLDDCDAGGIHEAIESVSRELCASKLSILRLNTRPEALFALSDQTARSQPIRCTLLVIAIFTNYSYDV